MLELNHITAGYGKRTVLSDLSVSFPRGSVTSVIGANGCGKSTLLKTMLGIVKLTDGEILADGERLSSLKRTDVAKRIAYLAQGTSVPDMTVAQLVLHGRFPHLRYPKRYTEGDKKIAHAAMERMGIVELAEVPMPALSGGMRQNAYLAMALAQDTDYILLDEPTTYLDVAHQLSFLKLLRGLAKEGKSIVTVTHDLPMAFTFSDRIAVIHGQRCVMQAPPREVAASPVLPDILQVSVERDPETGVYFYRYG